MPSDLPPTLHLDLPSLSRYSGSRHYMDVHGMQTESISNLEEMKGITPHTSNLHQSSVGKESTCNAGDPSSIPGLGRSTGEGIDYPFQYSWASVVAQLVKNPPAMQETWVGSPGWEEPLEKGKATTPVFWPREFHGLYSTWGRQELDTTE